MDNIYIIKVKDNLTQLEKKWGKANVRFGLMGKGIHPNYQIEGQLVTPMGQVLEELKQVYEHEYFLKMCLV
ncbi:hypothetical protein QUF50_00450 [Thiotrichales bacterium HSG1]|nr:hypothetical protein [Thiotrichales bacterium HSG1]